MYTRVARDSHSDYFSMIAAPRRFETPDGPTCRGENLRDLPQGGRVCGVGATLIEIYYDVNPDQLCERS